MILLKKTTLLLILAAAALVLAAGCMQPQPAPAPQPATTAPPATAAALPDTVRVSASAFGNILVDGQGRTLYFYADDLQGGGASACTGQCAVTWPPFSAQIRVSPPLDAADFGSFIRTDGPVQTSYKGWPLYYSSYDRKPGDINGSGIGGLWNVANVPGTVVTTPPTTVPTTRQTPSLAVGGGGGY